MIVIETGDDDIIFSVAFDSDGMQLLGGNYDGVRRWRVADGQEVGNQMAMDVNSISVSMDGKWIVCGGRRGASVWDAKTQDNVIEVDGTDIVGAVDISPDSARFSTAVGRGSGHKASIWNIITGERLVGPLQHDRHIAGIKFSPDGKHIATAVRNNYIRVFDSRTGDQLIIIKLIYLHGCRRLPLRGRITGSKFLLRLAIVKSSPLTCPPDPNWLNCKFTATTKSCLSL